MIDPVVTPIPVKLPTEFVTAIFTGLALLITAITGLVVAIMQLKAKAVEIHHAVNGVNSALLGKVDRATSRIADLTGKPSDIEESEIAHAEVVAKSTLPISKNQNMPDVEKKEKKDESK